MTARERVAQGPPAAPLQGFPTRVVEEGSTLSRAHLATRGPWWFGHDGTGRFDLPAPRGTCYLATHALIALRERIGPVLGAAPAVPETLVADVVVSALPVPRRWSVADLQVPAAGSYGVTRELETMVPYAVPQAWAQALDSAGHDGVAYGPRFTPGDGSAVAVFDEAGARDWAVDPAPVPAAEVPGAPPVMVTPRRADLTVVRPPRTRARPQP
jgi:RES domain